MVINYEFLDRESIENVITSMHYKIDKTVFFGYEEVIQEKKESMESFLKKYCGVLDVSFCALSRKRIESILEIMKKNIDKELTEGNRVYFDITGGEELILVAFGMLSKEYNLPVHMYDVSKNELIEFDTDNLGRISDEVERLDITPNLDLLVELQGCAINYNLLNPYNGLGVSFKDDAEAIYSIAYDYKTDWTIFASFLRKNMLPNSNLEVCKSVIEVVETLGNHEYAVNSFSQETLENIFTRLSNAGIIIDYSCTATEYFFKYKSKNLAEFVVKEGNALEYHYLQMEKTRHGEALVGVTIDWDGIIHSDVLADVHNEIDILSLDGVSLTFISCKCGRLNGQKVLHTLYELDTVARRCGGKYAKKRLIIMHDIKDTYKERAKEMGIEVELIP
ncbi:hypothetical protein SAMN02910369_00505 [Lachnospiraceae bacterium NE2001]|nr:hypothetical protein SAMN02910369_00505 [Lachnospiraceae bacterium NE2001]